MPFFALFILDEDIVINWVENLGFEGFGQKYCIIMKIRYCQGVIILLKDFVKQRESPTSN